MRNCVIYKHIVSSQNWEVALRFNFLFQSITEAALRTTAFKIIADNYCSAISNLFRLKFSLLYVDPNFVLFHS